MTSKLRFDHQCQDATLRPIRREAAMREAARRRVVGLRRWSSEVMRAGEGTTSISGWGERL